MLSRGQKASRILGRYDDDKAVVEIYKILKPVFYKKLNKLRPSERVFCFLSTFKFLTETEGFDGFYKDESGNYSYEIYEALETIGASQYKALFYESMKVYEGIVPKPQEERTLFITKHQDVCTELWTPLEAKFKTLDENFDKLLIEYVRTNLLEFR